MKLDSLTYRFTSHGKKYEATLYEAGDGYYYEVELDGKMHVGSLGHLVFPTVDKVRGLINKIENGFKE